MATIINLFKPSDRYETAAFKPNFSDWICDRLDCNKWYVVKRRSPSFRGLPWPANTKLILHREYNVLETEFKALFG